VAGLRLVDARRVDTLDDQQRAADPIARRQLCRISAARTSFQSWMTCFSR
jgi:hypothetical protein